MIREFLLPSLYFVLLFISNVLFLLTFFLYFNFLIHPIGKSDTYFIFGLFSWMATFFSNFSLMISLSSSNESFSHYTTLIGTHFYILKPYKCVVWMSYWVFHTMTCLENKLSMLHRYAFIYLLCTYLFIFIYLFIYLIMYKCNLSIYLFTCISIYVLCIL